MKRIILVGSVFLFTACGGSSGYIAQDTAAKVVKENANTPSDTNQNNNDQDQNAGSDNAADDAPDTSGQDNAGNDDAQTGDTPAPAPTPTEDSPSDPHRPACVAKITYYLSSGSQVVETRVIEIRNRAPHDKLVIDLKTLNPRKIGIVMDERNNATCSFGATFLSYYYSFQDRKVHEREHSVEMSDTKKFEDKSAASRVRFIPVASQIWAQGVTVITYEKRTNTFWLESNKSFARLALGIVAPPSRVRPAPAPAPILLPAPRLIPVSPRDEVDIDEDCGRSGRYNPRLQQCR